MKSSQNARKGSTKAAYRSPRPQAANTHRTNMKEEGGGVRVYTA